MNRVILKLTVRRIMKREEFLTVKQVSKRLFLAESTVRNKICNGDDMPPSFKFGRRRLFKLDEFELWLEKYTK